MIRLIEPGDPRLGIAAGEGMILAAIQGLAKTAGPGVRREVWLVEDGGETPRGAVCRNEHGILATAAGEEAAAEAAAFLEMMGELPGTVDQGLAERLKGNWTRFPVLGYRGEAPEEVPLCVPSVMGLVECNIAAGAVARAAREELYAELHLRVRRGAAQVFLVPGEDGKPVAGGCTLLGRKCAVIGYLACLPGRQRRGYGSAALAAAVLGAMERGRTPVLACRNGLARFYERRGFGGMGEVWERG